MIEKQSSSSIPGGRDFQLIQGSEVVTFDAGKVVEAATSRRKNWAGFSGRLFTKREGRAAWAPVFGILQPLPGTGWAARDRAAKAGPAVPL